MTRQTKTEANTTIQTTTKTGANNIGQGKDKGQKAKTNDKAQTLNAKKRYIHKDKDKYKDKMEK
jgi:hypothetical protein